MSRARLTDRLCCRMSLGAGCEATGPPRDAGRRKALPPVVCSFSLGESQLALPTPRTLMQSGVEGPEGPEGPLGVQLFPKGGPLVLPCLILQVNR